MGAGFCVWFTGLAGSGKSTLARQLVEAIEGDGRQVVLFDGDGDPGVERAERNTNVARLAAMAADVVKEGGIAFVTLISPYEEARHEARDTIGADRFVLVAMSTPAYVCEERDTKGLWDSARRQELRNFVGVEEQYEPARTADLFIDASANVVGLQLVLTVLRRRKLIA